MNNLINLNTKNKCLWEDQHSNYIILWISLIWKSDFRNSNFNCTERRGKNLELEGRPISLRDLRHPENIGELGVWHVGKKNQNKQKCEVGTLERAVENSKEFYPNFMVFKDCGSTEGHLELCWCLNYDIRTGSKAVTQFHLLDKYLSAYCITYTILTRGTPLTDRI